MGKEIESELPFSLFQKRENSETKWRPEKGGGEAGNRGLKCCRSLWG